MSTLGEPPSEVPVGGPSRKPVIVIPSEAEDLASFLTRLSRLVLDDRTHLYVDTSFLMWMTKIGSRSRRELRAWIDRHCTGRVHVPVWAAHEYVKHHVAGTIAAELALRTEEIASLVGKTYNYFRPFLDEDLGAGAGDPPSLRAATRGALNVLDDLVTMGRQWHKAYQGHASEVIAFVNAHVPEDTRLYDHFREVAEVGPGRFVGSVPPGHQDRRKKGSGVDAAAADGVAPPDSNRFGDLVFWRELLEHARSVRAREFIVLTNDRKNDWHMGGGDRGPVEPALLRLRKSWKPVPRPHPMLVTEARLVAGVEGLELLDGPYLAVLLRELAGDEVGAFVDVAIVPDGPEPASEGSRRAKLVDERIAADAAKDRAEAAEMGFLFQDAPEVVASPASLRRALLESRDRLTDRGAALLDEWRASVGERTSLAATLSSGRLDGLDHRELVGLARELHDRVIGSQPGFLEALADLISHLGELPPKTAGCLYLGLLASMYLHRERNQSRIPPASPVAQQLFDMQSEPIAALPIEVVAKRLRDNDVRPIYVPSANAPTLRAVLDTETSGTGHELRSLRIGDIELLTAAQSDQALRLASLFDGTGPVEAETIVRKACEIFAIPFAQVDHASRFDVAFTLTPHIGFKRAMDVSVPKE